MEASDIMKKRLIIAGVSLVALIGAAVLLMPRKAPVPVVVEPYEKGDDSAGLLYAKAGKCEKNGDLLSAKKIYKDLLREFPESGMVKDVRKSLDSVNIKILFSPVETQDSLFYEVKPGDNLSAIAKGHGTTVELIMKSNNLADTVIKPGEKLKISTAKYSVLVDKSQNILMLKSDEEVIKTYTVSTGMNNATPAGTYRIVNKLTDPTWYRAGAIVPSGSPENILGSRWMGLDLEGYGIHGTSDESTIGTHITKGCVRMRNKDVEELYSILPVGVEVSIID